MAKLSYFPVVAVILVRESREGWVLRFPSNNLESSLFPKSTQGPLQGPPDHAQRPPRLRAGVVHAAHRAE